MGTGILKLGFGMRKESAKKKGRRHGEKTTCNLLPNKI